MAFETAGENKNADNREGLPLEWENIEHNCCPKCGDELCYFDHIHMWKCFCGFKISSGKFEEIKNNIRDGDMIGIGSGYRYGNYHDEPPF